MPTITVNNQDLFKLLNKKMSKEELENIAFDFGLEIEEDSNNQDNSRVEIPANWYDLLSIEGLSCALKSYLKIEDCPRYKCNKGNLKLHVE